MPGVGISIGLSRLFWQLQAADLLPFSKSTVAVLVGLIDEQGLTAALAMARDLRARGINTESALEPKKLGQLLKYADRAGIELLVVAGPKERNDGLVLVRNLKRQNQQFIATADLVPAVVHMLAR